jgi:hypothetical protein
MKANEHSAKRIMLSVILLLFLSNLPGIAQYSENIIKAAYIERITRFVEWPADNKSLPAEQFVLGVYGDSEFSITLTEVFKEKKIKNHTVLIVSIRSPEQLNTCNLCYISGKAKPLIGKFVNAANSSGVLLISETADFCEKGVHINFYLEDEKLKFEINEKSILSAGFKVSYLLMQNTRKIQ